MYPTMKRLLALTLTLVLICASACAASFTARSSGKSYFTFNYDASRFSLDSESYLYGNAPGRSWFFMLYDGKYTIDCGMDDYAELYGVGSNSAQLSNFLCSVYGASVVEHYTAARQEFVILSRGSSYLAATFLHNRVVYFEVFNMLSGSVDSAALSALKSALSGFSAL